MALNQDHEGFTIYEEERIFIGELVNGTLEQQIVLDELISNHLTNWKLERLSAVDRNLLRLALYEIMFCPDIPPAVSINEALELAKKYGSSVETVKFINGVLDRSAGELFEGEQ